VNRTFALQRPVDDLERACSDGRLPLEILRLRRGILSDEDAINEAGTPFAASENFTLLRKHLNKALNITLTKKDVAEVSSLYHCKFVQMRIYLSLLFMQLMSEKPGAAADLVMRLKYAFEVADGLVDPEQGKNSLAAIKTLRPLGAFVRQSERFDALSPMHKALVQADLTAPNRKETLKQAKFEA
jgi:hypothetical protein